MSFPTGNAMTAITFSHYTMGVIEYRRELVEQARGWNGSGHDGNNAPWFPRYRLAHRERRLMECGLEACVLDFGYIDEAVIAEFSRASGIDAKEVTDFVKMMREFPLSKISQWITRNFPIFPVAFPDTYSERVWYFESLVTRLYVAILMCIGFAVQYLAFIAALDTLYLTTQIRIFDFFRADWLIIVPAFFAGALVSAGFFSCLLRLLFPPQAAQRHNRSLGIV